MSSKDQLYGWVVCLASFGGQALSIGFFYSFGTIYVALMREFHVGETEAAWVGSAAYAVCLFSGYGISAAAKRFGCRVLMIGGGVLSAGGFVLSSYVEDFNLLYATYGAMVALGLSNGFFCSLFILPLYFDRKLSFANGLVSSGSGIGALVISPLLEYLIRHRGFRATMRLYSMTSLLLVIGGLCYRRSNNLVPAEPVAEVVVVENEDSSPNTPILRNKGYLVWVMCLSLILFGNYIPFVHLVHLAEEIGIPSNQAALMPGYMSLSQSISKWIFGRIADSRRVNRLVVFQASLLVSAITITLCPLCNSFLTLLLVAVVMGFFDGCFCCYIFILTADIVKVKQINDAFGMLYTFSAGFSLLGPPFAGVLFESSRSYQLAFTVCGANLTLSVCLMFAIPFLLPRDVVHEKHNLTVTKALLPKKESPKSCCHGDSSSPLTTINGEEIKFEMDDEDALKHDNNNSCAVCHEENKNAGLLSVVSRFLARSHDMQWKDFVASSHLLGPIDDIAMRNSLVVQDRVTCV